MEYPNSIFTSQHFFRRMIMNRIVISAILALSLVCTGALASTESLNQGPKGDSMKLVPFTPLMMDAPFQIQYPEKWYAREEYAGNGNAGVFLTQEEITESILFLVETPRKAPCISSRL